MDYSDKWIQLLKAEEEYFTCRYNFMQDKEAMISNLEKALRNAGIGGNSETAMKLLRDMTPELDIIKLLLSAIMNVAIESSHVPEIGLARDVLYNYKDESCIRKNIHIIAISYFAENDEWLEWRYRRAAELYQILGYKEELTYLVLLCQESNDLEIQELADEFKNYLL